MNRTEHVLNRFTAHYEAIGAVPVVLSQKEWEAIEPKSNLRVALGFLRPTPASDAKALFCPELVVAQTEHLSDEELEFYLDAIQWTVDHETTLHEYDLDEATERADAALAETAPGSLRLMTEVQMAWLDRSRG